MEGSGINIMYVSTFPRTQGGSVSTCRYRAEATITSCGGHKSGILCITITSQHCSGSPSVALAVCEARMTCVTRVEVSLRAGEDAGSEGGGGGAREGGGVGKADLLTHPTPG